MKYFLVDDPLDELWVIRYFFTEFAHGSVGQEAGTWKRAARTMVVLNSAEHLCSTVYDAYEYIYIPGK